MDREKIEVKFSWSEETVARLGRLGEKLQKIKDAAVEIEEVFPGSRADISIKLTIPSPELVISRAHDEANGT